MNKILVYIFCIFIEISIIHAQGKKPDCISKHYITVEKSELVDLPKNCQFFTIASNYTIAYVDQKERGYGIKTINIIFNSGKIQKISNKDCKIFQLKFSPDNQWLSYGERKRDKASKIKLYNLSDNYTKIVENGDFDCGNLDFSPDSKKFVFTRYLEKGKTKNMEIVISDFTGSETIITENANFPKWSPTGDKIAICRVEPEQNSIKWVGYVWIYDLQKKDETKLYNSLGMASAELCWSPDGTKLAAHNGKNLGILDVISDLRVNIGGFDARSPSWSPDGSKLLFSQPFYKNKVSGIISDLEIFIVNSDGTSLRNLTNTKDILEDNPNWLGKNDVIIKSENNGLTKLYLLKINNLNQR